MLFKMVDYVEMIIVIFSYSRRTTRKFNPKNRLSSKLHGFARYIQRIRVVLARKSFLNCF